MKNKKLFFIERSINNLKEFDYKDFIIIKNQYTIYFFTITALFL